MRGSSGLWSRRVSRGVRYPWGWGAGAGEAQDVTYRDQESGPEAVTWRCRPGTSWPRAGAPCCDHTPAPPGGQRGRSGQADCDAG